MKILLLTPLFPPDTGDPAPYVKELAKRLRTHETTILMYGRLPESVAGVTMVTVDKRQWLPKRLLHYTAILFKHAKDKDLVIINNAPSTELPALLVSFFSSKNLLLCESDALATTAALSGFYKIIHHLLKRRCSKTITLPESELYKKSEVLPFQATDEHRAEAHEAWWTNHLQELTTI